MAESDFEAKAEIVNFKCSDGIIVAVPRDAVNRMNTIRAMLEELESDEEFIPLDNVNSNDFNHIVEYVIHYQDASPFYPADPDDPVDEICGWDLHFVNKLPPLNHASLILAADFLGIPDLVELMATHIAEQMKDKSPEEIRQFYNIVNDLTPEDIEQIDKENEWALSN